MRGLFDVSILLALIDTAHARHGDVVRWVEAHRADGWASCPLTQNGFMRVISQRSYPNPFDLPDAVAALRAAVALPDHTFWPDDLSLLDSEHVDHSRLLGPKQITDVYLLALAVKHGGRFVTLDTGISHRAARRGRPESLVVV